jgi:hypothetical protein
VVRNTYQFGEGFVTGKGDSTAGIAGAVTSDLTVIGDLRDIALEGGKMIAGEEYSELILGLSVVGIGVTAATIARPMPVFPEVGSMIVPPGASAPDRSAPSTIASAMRSLIEPPGVLRSLLM